MSSSCEVSEQSMRVSFAGDSLTNNLLNRRKSGFVINPGWKLYCYWETLNTLCTFLTCLTVSFQASFDSQPVFLWVFCYMFDVVFIADVFLSFFVGYYDKGSLITDRPLIRRRYLRGRFIPDFLALLPLDLLVFLVGARMRWHEALALLRLNRLLRAHRIQAFFEARERELGRNTSLIRTIKYATIGAVTIHVMSCGWYSLACANKGAFDQTCYPESWAVELKTGIELVGVGQRYVLSLYWATATATSTGFGDIHAVNMVEKWFSIFSMLSGIGLFFGFILGGMASMLNNYDAQRARYVHHLDIVRDHMDDKNISPDIRARVTAYYEYLWTHSHGVHGEGLFHNLSLTFQAELSLSVTEKVLEKAPLFSGLNPGFKRMLSLVIRPVFYMPNQIIASKGDIGHHMFYIHRGRAEILCDNDKDVLVSLKEGNLFGQVSMVYNLPRSASVRAATPCVVFTLDRCDLNKILRYYPKVAEQLYMAVDHRCDLNSILQTPAGNELNVILNMENEQADTVLRQKLEPNDPAMEKKKSLLWLMKQYVVMPDSRFAVIWERLVLACLLIICFVYTFVASFSISLHAIGYGETVGSSVLLVLTYFLDLILVMDFCLRFNMATAIKKELHDIRRSYKWSFLFWVDLLSILPIEILAVLKDDSHERWHLLSFLRLNRLLKAFRIPNFFDRVEKSICCDIGKVRAFKFTTYILLITHISACVWFFVACFGRECTPDSWAQHISRGDGKPSLKDYASSLYWAAASMSSTGYGDIHAYSTNSQLISIVVMLAGLLLYGYCLSSIAATLANSAAPKVEFFAKMTAVREYMVSHNLSPELIDKTERYLSMLWTVYRGEALPGRKRLMDDMPLSLQQDLTYEAAKDILEKVPIFMETNAFFLRELSLRMTSYLFPPGDYIVHAGDMGREMYCIRRGLVEIIGTDDITVVSTLGPGAYFGEIGLILGERRLASVRAKTYCELMVITKPDFDAVLVSFPVFARQIRQVNVDTKHMRSVYKAALKTSKAAVRRLSLKCAKDVKLPEPDQTAELTSQKTNRATPEYSDVVPTHPAEINFRQPYKELSPVFRMLSCLLMRRAILPDGHFFNVWQSICLVCVAIFPFTLSFQAAFFHTSTILWIVNYGLDLVCLIDTYIKFHLAFYNENNVLVTHPIYTARHYLRTNFTLDLLASFPTDIIVLAVWPENLGIFRILSLARLNRAFHLYKVDQYFQFVTESLGKSNNLIGQLKFALYMTIFTHCIACGWFLIPCKGLPDGTHECQPISWAEMKGRKLGQNAVWLQYLTSLYWASATSASVGYGDIHSFSTEEMVFSLFCMIIGIVFYGYIIASVAAGLANADAQRARYQDRLEAMKTFLQEQDIPEDLTDRVVRYYDYLWLRHKGVDASTLFDGLPLSLQADISLSLYKHLIERVPLFRETDTGFLKILSSLLKPAYFLAKEYVIREGDIGQEMYLIYRGTVELITEGEEPVVLDTLGEGKYFGEISVVFVTQWTASVRAQSSCDMLVLTKRDLDEILQHYPKIQSKIFQKAKDRQRMEQPNAFADIEENNEGEIYEGQENASPDPATSIASRRETIVKGLVSCETRLANRFVRFVIMPDSKLNVIKYVSCLLVFATTLSISYMAAYQDHPLFLIIFNYLSELFFYIEIYLKFHMAYRDSVGEIISDRQKLARHYLRGEFPLDLVASFPVDIFALAAPADSRLFVLSYLRSLHLLRLVRMHQFFHELSERLNINLSQVRVIKFFLQLLIVIHIFACLWYIAACPLNECSHGHNWVEHQGFLYAPSFSRYCTAVYWVVTTMTSTGYGDIHADNFFEMGTSSLVMIFGKLLFGFILGNIASTLGNHEISRVRYEEKLTAIQGHMKDQNIPGTLQKRVMNFYKFIWNKNKGIDHEFLFFDIPPCLNGELHLKMVKDVICEVPLFDDTELPFIRLLCTKVRPANFFANEFIVRRGDLGQEMFIIHKGLVEVITDEDPPRVKRTLEKGSYFGEKCLIHPCPQNDSVRAVTNVDVFILSKDDVQLVLGHYDNAAAKFKEVASAMYPMPRNAK